MPECCDGLLRPDNSKVIVISRASSRLDIRMHLQHSAALGNLRNRATVAYAQCLQHTCATARATMQRHAAAIIS